MRRPPTILRALRNLALQPYAHSEHRYFIGTSQTRREPLVTHVSRLTSLLSMSLSNFNCQKHNYNPLDFIMHSEISLMLVSSILYVCFELALISIAYIYVYCNVHINSYCVSSEVTITTRQVHAIFLQP